MVPLQASAWLHVTHESQNMHTQPNKNTFVTPAAAKLQQQQQMTEQEPCMLTPLAS